MMSSTVSFHMRLYDDRQNIPLSRGVAAWLVLFVSMAVASSGRPVHTISRFICVGCESEGQFCRLFPTRRGVGVHVARSPSCSKLGLGVREIRVAAGTGADVMAGGAGTAGSTPHVRHQPPGTNTRHRKGYPKFTKLIFRYPKNKIKKKISQDIPKTMTKKRISSFRLGYPFSMQKSQG